MMMVSVSVVNAVQAIWLLQSISLLAGAQNLAEMVCPVDVPDGYSVVGRTTYPHWVYFTCQGCNGQETWGSSQCKHDGTRDELILPNCTVSCHNSEMPYRCKPWVLQDCEFRPDIYWEKCGRSCDTPALCHGGSGESDCQCGQYAQNGRCETDANIRDTVCPYTCSRRAQITCSDPNLLFPHALASLQTKRLTGWT
ncbi:uncharacterized protein LOC124290046 [Haliotis rubra]|uniref:uncharacterized protein LOC124290046 n=1 Tax=Haliotis rubra TaxID=36100 RepID=UPI001EE54107|nr:uncharacterized protein LOC124290046 [Haliotis rubra]